MIVVGGSASNGLDISLSRALGANLVKVETSKFPDGEIKVRIPEFEDNKVVVVQSTYYPQEKNLFELLLIAEALREKKVNITAVVPYLAYARQNRSFAQGEAASVNVVLDLLSAAGVQKLITVNPHKSGPLMRFRGMVGIVNVIGTLAKRAMKDFDAPVVLAPDKGGLDIAKKAASTMKCDYTYIEKVRDAYGSVSIKKTHEHDFGNKDVMIFDDIISTGGTIEQAARFAYDNGARTVSAIGVHLVMAYGAYERLKKVGVLKIFGSNTMPFEHAEIVDVASDIMGEIRA